MNNGVFRACLPAAYSVSSGFSFLLRLHCPCFTAITTIKEKTYPSGWLTRVGSQIFFFFFFFPIMNSHWNSLLEFLRPSFLSTKEALVPSRLGQLPLVVEGPSRSRYQSFPHRKVFAVVILFCLCFGSEKSMLDSEQIHVTSVPTAHTQCLPLAPVDEG